MNSYKNHANSEPRMSEKEWLDIFANNLVEILKETRMSQKELADTLGLSEATVSNYIRKKQMPTIKAIINISYELGYDLYDLIDFGSAIE